MLNILRRLLVVLLFVTCPVWMPLAIFVTPLTYILWGLTFFEIIAIITDFMDDTD